MSLTLRESEAAQRATMIPTPVLRGLIRDFTAALGQQMYFWGRDVLHPDGNLLSEHGFARLPSSGLKGTSCYRMSLEDGDCIELHGACVGRYPADLSKAGPAGFLFIRTRQRVFLYNGTTPPAPGQYPEELLRPGSAVDLYAASCRFLDWWLAYETWISTRVSPGFRDACYRTFRKLPASAPWLPPETAVAWLLKYRDTPETVGRARNWGQHGSLRAQPRP